MVVERRRPFRAAVVSICYNYDHDHHKIMVTMSKSAISTHNKASSKLRSWSTKESMTRDCPPACVNPMASTAAAPDDSAGMELKVAMACSREPGC
jgi:hypothetical protein